MKRHRPTTILRAAYAPSLTREGLKRLLVRSEKDEERAGDRLMELYGFEIVRFSQPRKTMQTLGIPDRRYYHRARKLGVWWEAKREGGKQSQAQQGFQAMCEAVGETYLVGTVSVLTAWLESVRGSHPVPRMIHDV